MLSGEATVCIGDKRIGVVVGLADDVDSGLDGEASRVDDSELQLSLIGLTKCGDSQ
jgi:hypothetical protein